MERTVVKGRLIGPRNVELDQPVAGVEAEVEVTIRPLAASSGGNGESVFQYLSRLPAGNRTKDEIDQQVRDERNSWGDR
jgi:hypothetical protein